MCLENKKDPDRRMLALDYVWEDGQGKRAERGGQAGQGGGKDWMNAQKLKSALWSSLPKGACGLKKKFIASFLL